MARKMTGRERDDAEALRSVLVQELGPADRGYAPGIASALVRLPDGRATADDVERILGKYKVSANALKKMMRAGVLVPCADEDGAYDVHVPATVADAEEAAGACADGAADVADVLDAPADAPAPEVETAAKGVREDEAPDATAPEDAVSDDAADGGIGRAHV